jgi:hypothetical protein
MPDSLSVACCYCGRVQSTPEPPALVDCFECGRPFRVFRRESKCKPIELGADAKAYYQRTREERGT